MDASILPIPQRDRPCNADERSRFRGVFFDVAPSMFLGSLDQTIVAAALPAIASSLGGFAQIAWIVTAYLSLAAITAVAAAVAWSIPDIDLAAPAPVEGLPRRWKA